MPPTIIVNEARRSELQYSSAWQHLPRQFLERFHVIATSPGVATSLHTVFERDFQDFCDVYDEKYASTYGMFRLDRIRDIGERLLRCGDYRLGVARILRTNPACGHYYFRPFSCKGFYLCPSCSQKRTLLFAEHLTNEVNLDLPHRQFVFTMPKALRPFLRHDRRLFAEVSQLIYAIIAEFYAEAAGRSLLTGVIIAHQTFGDLLRWNPHYHCLVLEGGFDEAGAFVSVPLSGLQAMTEIFRRRVIWLLVEKDLLSEDFARNLVSWRNSGFSIDNSVQVTDARTQESLAQYISRPPVSLKKIRYEPFKGRVLFHTTYSEYFRANTHLFDALDFLAEAHLTKPSTASSGRSLRELPNTIPPRGVQLIRRYGPYASRTKGCWSCVPHVAVRAPEGWRASHPPEASDPDAPGFEPLDDRDEVSVNARKRRGHGCSRKSMKIAPLVCPKCGAEDAGQFRGRETAGSSARPNCRHLR